MYIINFNKIKTQLLYTTLLYSKKIDTDSHKNYETNWRYSMRIVKKNISECLYVYLGMHTTINGKNDNLSFFLLFPSFCTSSYL